MRVIRLSRISSLMMDEVTIFDPSWKDRVLNAKVPESEIGFKTHGDWGVVGYDEKPTNDNYGKFKWFLVCLRVLLHNLVTLDGYDYCGKGYGKRVWWHCNRPSCQICFRKGWAVRLASKMEHRLKELAKKYGRIEHVVLSPSKSDWGLTFPELCRKAVKIAKSRGIIGGSIVFHFFRYHKANETYLGEKAHFMYRLISTCLPLLNRHILDVGIVRKLRKRVILVVAFAMVVLVLKLL